MTVYNHLKCTASPYHRQRQVTRVTASLPQDLDGKANRRACFGVRLSGHGDDALCIKTANTQKGYGNTNLKPRPSYACGMGNHCDQRPIHFSGWYAKHQARTNLCG